jgi:hypothetical protein
MKRALDWTDPHEALSWLSDLRERIKDLHAAAEDATDPPAARALGRAEARRLVTEAKDSLDELIAIALRGLPGGGEPGDGEPGDGNGEDGSAPGALH